MLLLVQLSASQPQDAPRCSAGGDSVSLVYDSEDRCIGLRFVGVDGAADTPATTIINPIAHVLRELNVALLEPGGFPSAPPVAWTAEAQAATPEEQRANSAGPRGFSMVAGEGLEPPTRGL